MGNRESASVTKYKKPNEKGSKNEDNSKKMKKKRKYKKPEKGSKIEDNSKKMKKKRKYKKPNEKGSKIEDNSKKMKKKRNEENTKRTKNEKKYGRPASLQNIGANCYLNSALQGISSCDGFVDDFNEKYKELSKKIKDNMHLEKMDVFNNLIRTLNGKDDSGDRSFEISRNNIFSRWNKTDQQDSFELLSYMINEVFNEIRKFMEDNDEMTKRDDNKWLKVELPLRINIQYSISCGCNSSISTPRQTVLALHIPITDIKNTNKLSNLVDNFFKPDEIIGFKCDNENCDGTQAKRSPQLIQPLPNTLCIHLQKSYWNGWSMEKINSEVKFEKELEIKKSYVLGNSNDSKIIDSNYKYKLTSVIVHSGSVQGGHYVCYRRSKEKWFLTNDSMISKSSWKKLTKQQPYILFYEK